MLHMCIKGFNYVELFVSIFCFLKTWILFFQYCKFSCFAFSFFFIACDFNKQKTILFVYSMELRLVFTDFSHFYLGIGKILIEITCLFNILQLWKIWIFFLSSTLHKIHNACINKCTLWKNNNVHIYLNAKSQNIANSFYFYWEYISKCKKQHDFISWKIYVERW